ncbi:glutamate racemase [Variovorax sp. V213]|uniref:glutamate racemase n=1 Tax=Variovorax sp. V213 TaxID=3065955 RepID=UPI0034E8535A
MSLIGVFDSGVGGLSVLAALRAELPHERFVYFADTAFAPYGERGDAYVIERSRKVADQLVGEHGIKALVVACNTATTAAIHLLRAEHPALPIVGLEPALKPAVATSRTGHISVMATRGTLASAKYAALRDSFAGSANVRAVPCDGLVKAIEGFDAAAITALCARYMAEAGPFGDSPGEVDTVVLGCTHYPLVKSELQRHAPTVLRFIDTGAPVALQTRRVLASLGRLADSGEGGLLLQGSGDLAALEAAAAHWLQRRPQAATAAAATAT